MVETKNDKINLFTNLNKDKFANNKIGKVFPNLEDQKTKCTKLLKIKLYGMKLKWEKGLSIKN